MTKEKRLLEYLENITNKCVNIHGENGERGETDDGHMMDLKEAPLLITKTINQLLTKYTDNDIVPEFEYGLSWSWVRDNLLDKSLSLTKAWFVSVIREKSDLSI